MQVPGEAWHRTLLPCSGPWQPPMSPHPQVTAQGGTEPPLHCLCLCGFSRELDFYLKLSLCTFCFYFRLWRRQRKREERPQPAAHPRHPPKGKSADDTNQGIRHGIRHSTSLCQLYHRLDMFLQRKYQPHTKHRGPEHPLLTCSGPCKNGAWWQDLSRLFFYPDPGREQEVLGSILGSLRT